MILPNVHWHLRHFACFIFASYRVWKAERLKVLEAEMRASPLRLREVEAQEAHAAALQDQADEMRRMRIQREKENDPIQRALSKAFLTGLKNHLSQNIKCRICFYENHMPHWTRFRLPRLFLCLIPLP